MSLRARLEALVANPRLIETGTDVAFANSLLEHYNRKGSLTSGRRPWLDKLEAKYDEVNFVNPLDNENGQILKALLEKPELTDRDRAFAESLRNGLARWGNLSEKQQYALTKLNERYSEEGRAKRAEWAATYAENHKPAAVIAAQYYAANPPYYGDLARKILNDEGFVPSEKQYRSITENKYAQKVIPAALAEPKYAVNALNEARTSSSRHIRGKKAFVLKVDAAPVTSAAKGVKKYLVLPVGEAVPVLVEEREIKAVKGLNKK